MGDRSAYAARVRPTTGYFLCATPRTGSTWLCSLLSSTGVLGRPESYFREPDEPMWAERFNIPVLNGRARDYAAFIESVRTAATTVNGVFAARVMWGSLERIIEGLPPGTSDRDVLELALGPLSFVFLTREDTDAQARSWARAEQTGVWHEGDAARISPQPDGPSPEDYATTIRAHNAAWQEWFDRQGIEPLRVSYEGLVGDPDATVEGVASHLGTAVPRTWTAP